MDERLDGPPKPNGHQGQATGRMRPTSAGCRTGSRRLGAVVAAALAITIAPVAQVATAAAEQQGPLTSYVVRVAPGTADEVARHTEDLHGTVVHSMPEMGLVTVQVPAGAVSTLRARSGVVSVTPNASVRLMSSNCYYAWESAATYVTGSRIAHNGRNWEAKWQSANQLPGDVNGPWADLGACTVPVTTTAYDPSTDMNSLYNIQRSLGVRQAWAQGATGTGIDIAVLDSGVAPTAGLSGRIVNGPDLTPESQNAATRYLDTYGHGTHIAGIIAGRDTAPSTAMNDPKPFMGVAPDSRIVSVKVADARGGTDVTQIIAGLYWVAQHAKDPGFNIRVVNLSFGTDSTQAYYDDPLSYAVEYLWRKGIVVVTSAGNSGVSTGRLTNPATNPFVIVAAAGDTRGTLETTDDVVPAFSQRGDGVRNPDIAAPGVRVPSLRVTGSYLDTQHPNAVAATRFFRGSGTSQSAAIISGVAALMLQKRPSLTPDQVKAVMTSSAKKMLIADPQGQGKGYADAYAAISAAVPGTHVQAWQPSIGSGTLEGARGSTRLMVDGVELRGEVDLMSQKFDSAALANTLKNGGLAWNGGTFNGRVWAGNGWSGTNWTSATWSSTTWSGRTWTATPWATATWNAKTGGWSNQSWTSDTTWKGSSWSGRMWSGRMWSGGSWA